MPDKSRAKNTAVKNPTGLMSLNRAVQDVEIVRQGSYWVLLYGGTESGLQGAPVFTLG